DVPGFERGAVVRRDGEVVPSRHAVVVGRLEDEAPRRLDDAGDGLDLLVVLLGDSLLLFEGLLHPFVGNPAHDVLPLSAWRTADLWSPDAPPPDREGRATGPIPYGGPAHPMGASAHPIPPGRAR